VLAAEVNVALGARNIGLQFLQLTAVEHRGFAVRELIRGPALHKSGNELCLDILPMQRSHLIQRVTDLVLARQGIPTAGFVAPRVARDDDPAVLAIEVVARIVHESEREVGDTVASVNPVFAFPEPALELQ
jgi:hypothetical protein